jgi:hypothetical protein
MQIRPSALFLTSALIAVLLAACGSGDDEPDPVSTSAAATQPAGTSGVCARAIPPLTAGPVTKERLQTSIDSMREVRLAAEAGDATGARNAFSGDAHAITHDIDQPLRAADPQLAADLCESIVIIEIEFGGQPDLDAVAAAAEVSAGLLQESGRALGLSD